MTARAQSERLRTEHRAGRHETDGLDWYVEPRWAVDLLLDVERFDGMVWDPACGIGTVVDAVRARGIACRGTDLVDRCGRFPAGQDFLALDAAEPDQVDHILTNPPFRHAEAFVRIGLLRARRKVAILARLAFLEGIHRREFFATTPLARVWVFPMRVSMPPGGVAIEPRGGAVAYAWFVWDRRHVGVFGRRRDPVVKWLSGELPE